MIFENRRIGWLTELDFTTKTKKYFTFIDGGGGDGGAGGGVLRVVVVVRSVNQLNLSGIGSTLWTIRRDKVKISFKRASIVMANIL